MKKSIILGLALFFVAGTALASDGTLSHSNGNPYKITQPWGLTQEQTVTVGIGDTITNEAGLSEVCTFFHGCSDITKTDFYRNNMIETARQLIENGRLQFFPMFQYWGQFVR